MFAFEGIAGFFVPRQSERRRFEAGFRVTRPTVALIPPLSKLSPVPVLMTIQAPAIRQGCVEICSLVAFGTANVFVFPFEREMGSLMIEV
jgi:hypothetical protein